MPNDKPDVFIMPGMLDGFLWPHQETGFWTAKTFMMLASPKDAHNDWVFPIEIHPCPRAKRMNDRPPIPMADIIAAYEAFPNGWTVVDRERGVYPLPASLQKRQQVNA